MDIKEALVQIKRVPSVLEAFKSIEELLSLADLTRTQIDGLIQDKTDLENAISQRKIDFEQLKETCLAQTIKIQENLDKMRADSKEQLRNMKETLNKEYSESANLSNAKIAEMNEKATALKIDIKNLNHEIGEKQEFLASLKKDIDGIKARLT